MSKIHTIAFGAPERTAKVVVIETSKGCFDENLDPCVLHWAGPLNNGQNGCRHHCPGLGKVLIYAGHVPAYTAKRLGVTNGTPNTEDPFRNS